MKLRRFLLRYEPPGVGLEVEDGSGVTVQHKDLPDKDDIQGIKDLLALADEVIENEPTLLTRKRHRSAMIQLLGRLYQVDVTEGEEEATAGRGSEDEAASPTGAGGMARTDLQEGQRIVLTGLTGKAQVHNGEQVTMLKARSEKQKYEVQLPNGEQLKVRGSDHFLHIDEEETLRVGVQVAIRGLRNHSELNGCLAKVEECHEETARFEVRALETLQLFRVKKENLVLVHVPADVLARCNNAAKENREPNSSNVPRKKEGGLPAAAANNVGEAQLNPGGDAEDSMLEVGATVELTGLKTAQAYNGQRAEVLSIDRVRARYEIRLGDGSVKTIRSENVRLVGDKSSGTKRPKDKSSLS